MLDKTIRIEPVWLAETACRIDEFRDHVSRVTEARDYPSAVEIAKNVPIYDGAKISSRFDDALFIESLKGEWHHAFLDGPGIIVIRNAYDRALVDAVTEALAKIIKEEEAKGQGRGDHFAKPGANSRLWNAHEKLAMTDPRLFALYNANHFVRLASEAWLGPAYQLTTQVNVVRPGAKAQVAHRDYHMGFQAEALLSQYPASQHKLSASLTLQGAVAHTDMPLVSGPTKLLPYSQSYLPGYIAVLLQPFRDYFEEHYIQLPLSKGDLLFFNPATFHAAGENRTSDVHRFGNLMQIGSAYGRSIESVDRARIAKTVYGPLKTLKENGELNAREIDDVVAATAEGYSFPTNLDFDPPIGGMAPASQQDLMRQALMEGWDGARFAERVDEQIARKRTH